MRTPRTNWTTGITLLIIPLSLFTHLQPSICTNTTNINYTTLLSSITLDSRPARAPLAGARPLTPLAPETILIHSKRQSNVSLPITAASDYKYPWLHT
jgi:hypothetical protein